MADETKIIRIVVDSSAAIDGSRKATDALARMEKSLDQSKTAMERMEGGLSKVSGLLKAQILLHVAELTGRLVDLGRQAFEAAAGLDELAEQLGTNARALQGLQYQAVQYGVKAEQLETALSKFSQKMGEAADGSKDMVDALNSLGVKNLDFQGKLRPTEALMQDVAGAIVAIEDPAKRSAAAVDFFGKAGARMLPLLSEMAKGADNLSAAAERAGAMISSDTISRLDKISDKLEANKLKWRAQMAELLGDLDEAREKFNTWWNDTAADAGAWLARQAASLGDWAQNLSESVSIGGARASAMFLEAFRAMPDQLGKLFTDALNKALDAVESGINKISSGLSGSWLGQTLGLGGGTVSLGRLSGGGASFSDYTGQIVAAGDAAAGSMSGVLAGRRDAQARQAQLDRQAGAEASDTAARVGKLGVSYAPGASTSAVKGAGQAEADAIAKALRGARLDADTQDALAEASERGARAVADLEVHYKALKAAQDAYGKTADANKAGVEALTVELEKLMTVAEKGKNLKEFRLATEDLEKANVLLEAENRLINASAEDRAREIALIKTRQEILSKGLDETNAKEREAIERRTDAITQNERLKAQGDELKKANELWTQPLKTALESIQRTGADMWEQLLENGKFSAEEFGQIFVKMARRAAAELLALATIRPVMNFAVQGLGSLGLVSPATASSLGYGSASGGGLSGGGGLFPSGGGSLGGLLSPGAGFGSFGSWMNTPFTGPYAGISPAAMEGVPVAASTAPGLTPLGAFAGAASIGLGAYNLFSSRSTGGKIGGAAGMLGGAMGLVGALAPGMAALGPIGMGVGLLASVLPMLFGGGEQERPPMPPLNYGAGLIFPSSNGRYIYGGDSLNAGQPMTESARGIGGRIDTLFSRAGVTVVPGQLIGGDIASGTNNTWSGGGWQSQNYTQIGLHTPTGYERITYNDPSRSIEQATDLLIATIFKSNVLRGGVSGASESLKTAVRTANPATEKGVTDLVDFVAAYDKLGKAVNTAQIALEKVDQKFIDMAKSAGDYGLAVQPITDAQAKERKRYAQDYLDAMLDPMQVDLRLLKDQRESALASAEYIRDNIKDVYVDINKITDYYLKKEADLKKKYVEDSYGDLQKVIDKLTFGSLANASPLLQFTGQRGSYLATLAQAKAGSFDANNRLADVADAYATAGRIYFGSSSEYAALADQIRKDLIERQGAVLGGDTGKETAQTNALLKETMNLQSDISTLTDTLRVQSDQIAALTAQLARR